MKRMNNYPSFIDIYMAIAGKSTQITHCFLTHSKQARYNNVRNTKGAVRDEQNND